MPTGPGRRRPQQSGEHAGRAGVILLAFDGRGSDYRIRVRSSFAWYLADWLLDAVAQYAPGEP